jgi:hypothetical protein
VDVITAYEDGASELADSALLDRAMELGRVLFTQDNDFLTEGTYRQRNEIPFAGVIYAHQRDVPLGVCIADLEIITKAENPEDLMNNVIYLPL